MRKTEKKTNIILIVIPSSVQFHEIKPMSRKFFYYFKEEQKTR